MEEGWSQLAPALPLTLFTELPRRLKFSESRIRTLAYIYGTEALVSGTSLVHRITEKSSSRKLR